jgi:hypothetical protein
MKVRSFLFFQLRDERTKKPNPPHRSHMVGWYLLLHCKAMVGCADWENDLRSCSLFLCGHFGLYWKRVFGFMELGGGFLGWKGLRYGSFGREGREREREREREQKAFL